VTDSKGSALDAADLMRLITTTQLSSAPAATASLLWVVLGTAVAAAVLVSAVVLQLSAG